MVVVDVQEINMGNAMKKKDDNVTQLSEYKGFQALQKSVGGLATITDKKLAIIAEKMVEIDRVNHTAGRSQTQTTNQLMSLTMMRLKENVLHLKNLILKCKNQKS